MSTKQLKMAARLKVPQQIPELETKLLLMVLADRADDDGNVAPYDDDGTMDAIINEVNAVRARLRSDPFVRSGFDNERVNRIVKAFRDAENA
jgi:hypothetical protein